MCAPVWDSQQNGYLGFFDVNDALSISYDIDLISQATGDTELAKQQMRTTAVQVFEIFNQANQIRNPDLEAPWIPVGPLATMKDVIPVLASGRARRVPIVDPDTGKVLKLISQMDIVRQLHLLAASNRDRDIPPVMLQSPASTGIGMRPVLTILEDQEARDAFRMMIDNNVSCVGVLDDEGRLIGCISNKDIQVVMRGMQTNGPAKVVAPMMAQASRSKGRFSIAASMTSNQDLLGLPPMMFVNEVRKEFERNRRTHVAVCEAAPETSFKEIVAKLYATGHHRIFLVDENNMPVGLVSIADICGLVYSEIKPKETPKKVTAPPPIPKRNVSSPNDN